MFALLAPGASLADDLCSGFAANGYFADPAAGKCATPFRPGANFAASLEEFLRKTGIHDSVGLMPCLPAELRRSFTLVPAGSSAQDNCSDAKNPRILLFSRDGRQMITFPGEPERPGCDNIEVMSYDEKRARFVPDRIPFPSARRDPDPRCGTCHGEDWTPKLDPYPNWPGFFGSVDDFERHDREAARSLGNRTDTRRFQEFMSTQPFAGPDGRGGRGLYRFLIRPRPKDPADAEFSPYRGPKNDGSDRAFRPNLELTGAVIRANSERYGARLARAPGRLENKLAAAAVLLGCPLPDPLKRRIEAERREIEPVIVQEGRELYCRHVESEGGKRCDPRKPPPCALLEKTGIPPSILANFCGNEISHAPLAARYRVAASLAGLTSSQIDALVPRQAGLSSDPSHRTLVITNSVPELDLGVPAATYFRELARTQPFLMPYLERGSPHPLCLRSAHPGRPYAASRCEFPETCELPPMDYRPRAGAPSTCEILLPATPPSGATKRPGGRAGAIR